MSTYYAPPPDAVTLLHNLVVVTITKPNGESTFTSDYRADRVVL